MLRHTKSLSNHFALLPRSHRGPVSILAGYSALFISAPGSYLLSPGSQMKCFSLKRKDQIACVLYSFYFSEALAESFQFISVLHRHFLHPSHKAVSSWLPLSATQGEILLVLSFMAVWEPSADCCGRVLLSPVQLRFICVNTRTAWDPLSFDIFIFHKVQIINPET